ncbi:MAG: hypothetical protein WCT01_03615 [Candidatus Shapirobacteria bacterium]
MVRSKLSLLLGEIKHYIGMPYARNVWKNGALESEAVFGGKAKWTELVYATNCAATLEKLNLQELSPSQIYNLQKRHKIGIDCSGLTYHLSDYWDQLHGGSGILFKVVSSVTNQGRLGPRSLSANQLTLPHNSLPITDLNLVKTGDFIRMDKGRHIVFVTQKLPTKIIYINSSNRTTTRGVHFGQITLTHPNLDLTHQLWSDTTLDLQPYTSLFFPNSGDGVYRLICFSGPTFLQ